MQGAIRVIAFAEDCRAIVSSDIRQVQSDIVFEQLGRRDSAL